MTGQISQYELDKLFKRLITDGAQAPKVPLNPSVSPIMFDSKKSERRFLELLSKEKKST